MCTFILRDYYFVRFTCFEPECIVKKPFFYACKEFLTLTSVKSVDKKKLTKEIDRWVSGKICSSYYSDKRRRGREQTLLTMRAVTDIMTDRTPHQELMVCLWQFGVYE